MSKGEGPSATDLRDHDVFRRRTEEKRKAGAPPGNQNGRSSGIYINGFDNDEEHAAFEKILERLRQDFEFNKSSDLIQAELAAIYLLRLNRAQAAGDFDAATKLDPMIRGHLKDLKATKLSREADDPHRSTASPADWAASVLEKSRVEPPDPDQEAAKEAAPGENVKKTSDNSQ